MSSTNRRGGTGGRGGRGGGDLSAGEQPRRGGTTTNTSAATGRIGLVASSTPNTTTSSSSSTTPTTPPRGDNNINQVSSGGEQQWGSASRFGHFAKYTKPKIGPAFQCAVPLYVPPEQQQQQQRLTRDGSGEGGVSSSISVGGTSENGYESGGSASGSAESSSAFGNRAGTGRGGGGGRGRGRGYRSRGGGRGGRGRGGGRGGRGRGGGGGSSGAGEVTVGGGGGSTATAASSKRMMCEGMEQSIASGETSAVDIANAAAAHMQVTYGSRRIIPRGGLCVHKPPSAVLTNVPASNGYATNTNASSSSLHHPPHVTMDELDEFLIFSRNIFLQAPRPNNEIVSIDDIWDNATAKKFEVEAPLGGTDTSHDKTGSRGGRGNKRKALDTSTVDDDGSHIDTAVGDILGVGDYLNDGQPTNAGTKTMLAQNLGLPPSEQLPLCGMEDDEQALAYLHANHHGDSQRAKLSIMVHYDRGYGVQRRRQLKKKRKEAKASIPDATAFTSESWRWRVHQARPTMLGDYRSSSDSTYHYFDPVQITTSNLQRGDHPWRLQRFTHVSDSTTSDEIPSPNSRLRSCSITWSTEEIEKAKKIWKSILAYSNNVLVRLNDCTDIKCKPPLIDLLELVTKAHALPTPEEAFGRRDPSARQMSENMNAVIDAIERGRNCVARILKCLKDDGEGIELDALQKVIDEIEHKCPVGLVELDAVKRQVKEATLWEEKLENNIDHGTADSDASDGEELITEKKLTLEKVERLVSKGQNLSLRPQSLVRLQNRIERAHILRRRIAVWNEARNQENPQNLKFVSTLIKQANKIDLAFPELFTLTGVHKKAEEWMDRASIAVRTTISFDELQSLVSIGERLPLNVSDVLEKLQNRLKQARDWMARVEEIVPKSDDYLVWLRRFRHALDDSDKNAHLVSLLAEESRIPVTMECSKLLQIEIDARNWSAKAKPWIPENLNGPDSISAPQRRGKIDDVEECLDRASSIRDRLWFGDKEKSEWVLDGEAQLVQMVEMAEAWFEKHDDIITYDSRGRKGKKLCVPMSTLRDIVEEVNRIPMNLGNPSMKMNRIFSQADEWMKKYYPLLQRCGIESSYIPAGAEFVGEMSSITLKINDLSTAISDADSDLTIDLDVIVKLRDILNEAQSWIDRVNSALPKHDARKKGKLEKHTLQDLSDLIDESTSLIVDVTEELGRLNLELSTTLSWRIQAQINIREITNAFLDFRSERANASAVVVESRIEEPEPLNNTTPTVDGIGGSMTTRNINSRRPCASVVGTSAYETTSYGEFEGKLVFSLVSNFLKSVKSINVQTPEEGVADELNEVIVWLTKSSKLLNSPSEIYDRKVISKLDKCIESGRKLVDFEHVMAVEIPEDTQLVDDLRQSWAVVVKDDVAHLMNLQLLRNKFIEWCKLADGILASTDKKVSIDSLKELEVQCDAYPSSLDIVLRVKTRAKDATTWLAKVTDIVNSDRKITIDEAKGITDEGERLNISCPEYKIIRAALKTTRGWLLRVKKCGAANGHAQVAVAVVTELINEHDSFLVTAMDELSILKQAMCGYCICRQPYEGFMIGCDGCDEWYHGACIGVTQEQAQKFDKYVCVRCSTLRIYSDYAASVGSILRKWMSAKGLAAARLAESQRYVRKVRSAERDIAKAKADLENYEQELAGVRVLVPAVQPYISEDSQASTVVSESKVPSSSSALINGTGLKSEKALLDKIEKARTVIASCDKRMEGYKVELAERQKVVLKEDSFAPHMKMWCNMVKQEVFAPLTREKAELSRPQSDGSNSAPMDKAIAYAQSLGIVKFPDVDAVLISFKIFAWCLQLLEVLMRKPKVEEIRSLLSHSESGQFKLPEAKCVRMLRTVTSRALIWQAKAKKALQPIAGEVQPYDLAHLREILQAAKEIPFAMPEETQLWNTIEDQGTRHCICGGPGDGSFMLGCDNCDKWFHGSCMKIDTATGDALSNWMCPPCSEGKPVQDAITEQKVAQSAGDKTAQDIANTLPQPQQHHLDISPHAPNPISLWPPFGLRCSKEAIEALGKVGDSDNEDFQSPVLSAVRAQSVPSSIQPSVSAVPATVPSLTSPQCQLVSSLGIATVQNVSQSGVCREVLPVEIKSVSTVASASSSQSSVGIIQLTQSQPSDITNNQKVIASLPQTPSATTTAGNIQIAQSQRSDMINNQKVVEKFPSIQSSTVEPSPTVENIQAAQIQRSDMINNQKEVATGGPSRSDMINNHKVVGNFPQNRSTIEPNHPPSSATHYATVVATEIISPLSAPPTVGINSGQTTNNSGLGADLSVAVANLDVFVLSAEDMHQLPSGSTTADSVETGAVVKVSSQPP